MNLKEFWESDDKLAIHCETEEEANKFCNESHKLGHVWKSGDYYKEVTNWDIFQEETCYTNDRAFCFLDYLRNEKEYKIIEFDEIEWEVYL